MHKNPALLAVLLSNLALSGCATFSPDGGMTVVANVAGETIQKDVVAIHNDAEAEWPRSSVQRLLRRPLTVDAAVQIGLLNNKGLQASYNELALAEADMVQESLPPNPTFSIFRIAGDGALEAERQIVGNILALSTLPFRSEIARQRFQKGQLRAAEETLRLAADVRRTYFRAVAANELAGLLTDAKATAESTAQLASKLGQTGALNKLDQAREQVFYAETTAELATVRQDATSSRERLIRLLGLWDGDLGFRLPQKLPDLPRRPLSLPGIEVDAVEHRIDLQIARILSTGDMLREAVASRSTSGLRAKRIMDRGELVPHDVVVSVVINRIDHSDAANGFILDGFPRTVTQAEALDQELATRGIKLDAVLELEVDEDALLDRIRGRAQQAANNGESIRSDDNPEIFKARLDVYRAQTAPVTEYYRSQGLLNTVDGLQSIDVVTEELA